MRYLALLLIFFPIFTVKVHSQIRDRVKDRDAYKKDDDVKDLYEKLRGEVVISSKYRAGSYLIYDCEDKHFVCADEVSYKLCERYRKEDLDKKKDLLSCGAIKMYSDPKTCNKEVYKFVHRVVPKDFCRNIQDFLKKF